MFIKFTFLCIFLFLTSCIVYIQDIEPKKTQITSSQSQNIDSSTKNELNNLNPLPLNNEKINPINKGYITPDVRKISSWNIDELDLGKDSKVMSNLEKDILLVSNMARTNPSKFSDDFISPLLNSFENNSNIQILDGLKYTTEEGKSVIEETIKFLKNQSSLKPLNYRIGLRMGAMDHVKDQGQTELTGHTGSDGSTSSDRMNRYGKWSKVSGENIDYGNKNGLDIIVALIVDDGVKTRGHRNNIFTSEFNFVGIACGDHKKYKIMCVQDFAGEYN